MGLVSWLTLPTALLAAWGAWELRPPPPLEGSATSVPRPSALNASGCNGAPWPRAPSFSREEREAFERDGFAVLRNFVTPAVVAALTAELRHVCATWPGPMDPKFACFRTGTWLRHDVSRDFLYHGPAGETARRLLGVDAVRIQEDGFFVHTEHHGGQPWHTDMDQYGGVFSEFHSRTRGLAMWVALTDVDHEVDGGSVVLARGGPWTNCTGKSGHWARRQRPMASTPDPACESEVADRAVVHSFRAGDAMVWHPWMPHRTQPSKKERLSWYARIVEADAVLCHREYRAKTAGRQAECQHSLRPGQKAHHVCFQQLAPLLEEEVAQRMSPGWRAPILQPTPLGNLAFKLRTMLDKLRMAPRRDLWAPATMEKPECID